MAQTDVLRLPEQGLECPLPLFDPEAPDVPMPTIYSRLVLFTPYLASVWLERNIGNRKPRRRQILQIGWDMTAGAYIADGAPVRVDKDGFVIDGQDRLMGVIESGVATWLTVCWNIDPAARIVVDTSRPRSLIDVLRSMGDVENTHGLSVAVKVATQWACGHFDLTPSHQQMMRWLRGNPDIRQAVTEASTFRVKPLRWPYSSSAPFIYRAGREWVDETQAFVFGVRRDRTMQQEPLRRDDPRHLFRQYLLRCSAMERWERPAAAAVLANAVHRFNQFIAEERGGSAWNNRQPFPELVRRDAA